MLDFLTPGALQALFEVILIDVALAGDNAVVVGINSNNPGPQAASVDLECSDSQRMSVTVSPDQLLRVRTGWQQPCASVTIEFSRDAPLRFDNLAYLP